MSMGQGHVQSKLCYYAVKWTVLTHGNWMPWFRAHARMHTHTHSCVDTHRHTQMSTSRHMIYINGETSELSGQPRISIPTINYYPPPEQKSEILQLLKI